MAMHAVALEGFLHSTLASDRKDLNIYNHKILFEIKKRNENQPYNCVGRQITTKRSQGFADPVMDLKYI